MIDPYTFVRAITISLATFWTLRGVWRMVRFARRWEHRLHPVGMPRPWLRRQIGLMVLRASLFDPLSCGMFAVLVGLWLLRRWVDV